MTDARVPFPEPTSTVGSRAEIFLGYLDYFRAVLREKVSGLPEDELRRSRLPSGWAPLELVKHLTYVELRWLEWGFEGSPVGEPWADQQEGRWRIEPDESRDALLAALTERAARSRAIVEAHELSEQGRPGPRWGDAEPANLERILFHLVQEYARHIGHLDIVRELADGSVGE